MYISLKEFARFPFIGGNFLFLLAFLVMGGCDDEEENDVPAYNSTGLCADGNYETDQSQYLTQTMYKILGMLDEYISRFNWNTGEPDPEFLENFYPSETELADHFEELVAQLGDETEFSFEYERDENDFTSTELSALINGYYIKPDGNLATLDRNVFCNTSDEDKLAYIEGFYMRYGNSDKENWIGMANAPDKVVTLGWVLEALGCENVELYLIDDATPTAYYLFFDPGPLVEDSLGIENVLSVKELKEKYPELFGEARKSETIR